MHWQYASLVLVVTAATVATLLILFAWRRRHAPGSAPFMLLTLKDRLSAKKGLQESLMLIGRAKREWESTADSLPQLICLMDNQGHILRANRTVERWNLGQVVNAKGQRIHELVHPRCADPDCYMRNFWSQAWEELACGRSTELEVEDRAMGRQLLIQVQPILAQAHRKGEETDSYAVVILNDITERKRAEEALRENEERYHSFFDNSIDAVLLTGPDGKILKANAEACRIFGRTEEELCQVGRDGVVDLSDPRLPEALEERERTGKFKGELRLIRKDGTKFPAEISSALFKGREGFIRTSMIIRDITERKQAEEALKRTEEKYRDIVENAVEGIFQTAPEGRFISANPALARIHGFDSPEELISSVNALGYEFFVDPDRRAEFARLLHTQGVIQNFEAQLYRKDGSNIWVSMNTRARRNSKGKLLYYEGSVQDITEGKRAEQLLETEKKRFQTLSEGAPFGMVMIDRGGGFRYINPKFKELFGYDLNDVPNGKAWFRKTYPDTNYRHNVISTWINDFRSFEEGEKRPRTFTVTCKDGTEKIVSFIPVQLEGGENLMTCEDITDRMRFEESIRESEEKYRNLVDRANDGIAIIQDGILQYINLRLAEMANYTIDELIGTPFVDHLDPDEVPKLADRYKRRMAGEDVIQIYGTTLRRKDGNRIDVEINAGIITYQGRPADLVIVRDISERKRAEEALRESEKRYRTLFEDSRDAIYTTSREGKILDVNQSMLDLFGYNREEMIGLDAKKTYVHPEDRLKFQQEIEHKGYVRDYEIKLRKKDGTEMECLSTSTVRRGTDQNILEYQGTIRDITESKHGEERLKQSEENARQLAQENAIIAEIGRIISSTLNIDEVYEGFSREVKKIIPFDRIVIHIIDTEKGTVKNVYIAGKELQDRKLEEVYFLEGSGSAEMVRTNSTLLIQTDDFNEYKDRFPMLLSTFQAGFRSIMNVPLFSKGKIIGGLLLRSRKPYAYTDKDVRLAERIGSQIAGAVANAQLYTERIQVEKERTSLEEQFRQSQKMEAIGRLAGGVAHDFNNLLTVIKGYSQLSLTEMKEEDPFRENIEEIQKSADRASDLTRQLLAFSRHQVMEMKVLDLNTVLNNLDKMLHRVIGEDVELVFLLAKDLVKVKTDPGQIEQVIMNLVVNARDAMPNGGKLTIETANVYLDQAYARAHVAVASGPYVMISVSDTGVGMTPEVRERVFDPFFTTKEKGKGTGLGLPTVYGIVEQSGGNIWVYSEPGKGTTFKIYLPRVDEPLEELKEKVVKEELPRGNETILIVEDEENVLKLAGRILRRQGYTVLEASQGDKALRLCEEHKGALHLILTDVVMPEMSGRQLVDRCWQVRQDFKTLYMSGYTDNAITHHGVLEKGTNYIQKPFTVNGLARKVREVLDKA